jgi:hypothetical protein
LQKFTGNVPLLGEPTSSLHLVKFKSKNLVSFEKFKDTHVFDLFREVFQIGLHHYPLIIRAALGPPLHGFLANFHAQHFENALHQKEFPVRTEFGVVVFYGV